jgi:hypothetical protein
MRESTIEDEDVLCIAISDDKSVRYCDIESAQTLQSIKYDFDPNIKVSIICSYGIYRVIPSQQYEVTRLEFKSFKMNKEITKL